MGDALGFEEVPFCWAGGGEDFCACGLSDLDGGLANAACGCVNENFVARLEFGQMVQAIVSGEEGEGKGGGFSEADVGGFGNDEF